MTHCISSMLGHTFYLVLVFLIQDQSNVVIIYIDHGSIGLARELKMRMHVELLDVVNGLSPMVYNSKACVHDDASYIATCFLWCGEWFVYLEMDKCVALLIEGVVEI